MSDLLFHPRISSFPIAFLYLLLAFEIVSFFRREDAFGKAGEWITAAAFIALLASFFTGDESATQLKTLAAMPEGTIARHHVFGKATLIVAVPLLLLKLVSGRAKHSQTLFKVSYWVLLITTVTLATITGFLGGELVFKYGVGVG